MTLVKFADVVTLNTAEQQIQLGSSTGEGGRVVGDLPSKG